MANSVKMSVIVPCQSKICLTYQVFLNVCLEYAKPCWPCGVNCPHKTYYNIVCDVKICVTRSNDTTPPTPTPDFHHNESWVFWVVGSIFFFGLLALASYKISKRLQRSSNLNVREHLTRIG